MKTHATLAAAMLCSLSARADDAPVLELGQQEAFAWSAKAELATTFENGQSSIRFVTASPEAGSTHFGYRTEKGLPAGTYVAKFTMTAFQGWRGMLSIMQQDSPWRQFRKQEVTLKANEETAIEIPFKVTPSLANTPIRIPGILFGGIEEGAAFRLSTVKVYGYTGAMTADRGSTAQAAAAPAAATIKRVLAKKPADFPTKKRLALVLLVGQSNMAGRGVVTDENDKLDPRVFMLTRNDEWVVAKDPVHYDKPVAGVGAARTFAAAYLQDHPDACVGLVPTACGGSNLDDWLPGGFCNGTSSHPWDDAAQRIATASQDGEWKAVLFHQGESDCGTAESQTYGAKLEELLARIRVELRNPSVPILIGELPKWGGRDDRLGQKLVTAAHKTAAEKLPPAAFVPSTGLTANPDNIHFDATSQKEFGRRYYEAFKRIAD